MKARKRTSLKTALRAWKRSPLSLLLRVLVWLAAVLTIGTIVFLIGYILVKGVPHIKPSLFAWEYNSENVSLMPARVSAASRTALTSRLPRRAYSLRNMAETGRAGLQ